MPEEKISSFKTYMKDISKYKLLTKEEEFELGLRIKNYNDREAINELVNHNLRLVVTIAKTYVQNTTLNIMDLIQEGNIGLLRAAEKYDCDSGNRFSTHAVWWIKQAISKAVVDQSRTIRLPANIVDEISKVKKAMKTIEQRKSGNESTVTEIAKELGFTEEKVISLLNQMKENISLEYPIGDEDDTTVGDLVSDKTFDSPIDSYIQKETQELLLFILDTLLPREKIVIEQRFGLNQNEPKTLEEVGESIGVSKERVRQIEDKALRKLRHPSRSNAIKECLV